MASLSQYEAEVMDDRTSGVAVIQPKSTIMSFVRKVVSKPVKPGRK